MPVIKRAEIRVSWAEGQAPRVYGPPDKRLTMIILGQAMVQVGMSHGNSLFLPGRLHDGDQAGPAVPPITEEGQDVSVQPA